MTQRQPVKGLVSFRFISSIRTEDNAFKSLSIHLFWRLFFNFPLTGPRSFHHGAAARLPGPGGDFALYFSYMALFLDPTIDLLRVLDSQPLLSQLLFPSFPLFLLAWPRPKKKSFFSLSASLRSWLHR